MYVPFPSKKSRGSVGGVVGISEFSAVAVVLGGVKGALYSGTKDIEDDDADMDLAISMLARIYPMIDTCCYSSCLTRWYHPLVLVV